MTGLGVRADCFGDQADQRRLRSRHRRPSTRDVARTLARLYAGARQEVVDASLGFDAAPFDRIAATLAEIADAWRALKPATT